MKTTLAVLAMILAPSFAAAMGCSDADHTKQVMSCAMGSTWDETTQACVPTTS
ncbi:MAG: hypothetical protein AAGK92_08040 [Pseudomonadota bacterium]